MNNLLPLPSLFEDKKIEDCILEVRGQQVMLDSDIAKLFEVETKALNQQMKRNLNRFPDDFCFQLTDEEANLILRSQNVTSNILSSKRRYNPYVYTEHGIMALAGVIKSDIAAKMSIEIVRIFVQMRKFVMENADVFTALAKLQNRQLEFENETNRKFEQILNLLQKLDLPKASLFFAGEWYDAFDYITSIINKANKSIILIDPYCDSKALTYLSHRKDGVQITIIKSNHTKINNQERQIFEKQYGPINIKSLSDIHDRYLIIDEETCYSLGTSLNYAGKKLFTVILIEDSDTIRTIIEKTNR